MPMDWQNSPIILQTTPYLSGHKDRGRLIWPEFNRSVYLGTAILCAWNVR